MAWFRRKADESGGKASKVIIAEGLWIKCDSCKEIMYRAEVERAGRVCPKCHYPFRISARERIAMLADPGSFEERDTGLATTDPLTFKDTKKYRDRVRPRASRDAPAAVHLRPHRSDDRRRHRELRDARRRRPRRAARADRLRRPPGHRRDDPSAAARGIPALRVPAHARPARHDRR